MAYASFRCQVKAPLAVVWQRLRDKLQTSERALASRPSFAQAKALLNLPNAQPLREEIIIDAARSEIVVRLLDGQNLQGERRFVLRATDGTSGAFLETILNWKTASAELDREIMKAAVEVMVRDFALEIKQAAEVA